MGLRDTIRSWLTPMTDEERLSVFPAALPRIDTFWPYFSMGNQTYPIGLQQTLTGRDESIAGDYAGLTYGGYLGNSVVFTCLNARMALFKQARFMYRQLRNGTPGDLFSTAALEILRTPWPNGTTSDLLSRMIQDADLGGNAFILRRGNRLVRLRPDWVTIIHEAPGDANDLWDPDAELVGYAYQPGGPGTGQRPELFLPEQVAHFAPLPDPLAPARGISWLTPILREIEADSAAVSHKIEFFRRGATPSMIVTGITPAAGQSLQDWVDKWRTKNEGVKNAWKTQFYTAGVDAKTVGVNLRDIDYKAVTGAGETRIAAAAGVPPIVAGLSEGLQGSSLNAGNFAAAMRRFADLTGRALWEDAAGTLATIVPRLPAAELWYDDRYIPALKDDVKDFAEVQARQAQAISSLVSSGFEPDSIVDAINAGDLKRLKHTGLYSVQLQPPQPEGPPEPTVKVIEPPAPKQIPATAGRSELLEYLLDARQRMDRYSPDQPRVPGGEHGGEWTATGGGSLQYSGLAKAAEEGGFSVTVHGDAPSTGYMVSPYEGAERKYSAATFTSADVHRYRDAHRALLARPDHYLGGWRDGDTIYLDVSIHAASRSAAGRLARQHHQLAFYDLGSGRTIPTEEAA